MTEKTIVFMLISEENSYWQIIDKMRTKYGFEYEVIIFILYFYSV